MNETSAAGAAFSEALARIQLEADRDGVEEEETCAVDDGRAHEAHDGSADGIAIIDQTIALASCYHGRGLARWRHGGCDALAWADFHRAEGLGYSLATAPLRATTATTGLEERSIALAMSVAEDADARARIATKRASVAYAARRRWASTVIAAGARGWGGRKLASELDRRRDVETSREAEQQEVATELEELHARQVAAQIATTKVWIP